MGLVDSLDVPEMSPEEASRGRAGHVRDDLLPMLAAGWLAQGFDSEELRELAGLSSQESRQRGRRLLIGVLASLGYPMRDRLEDVPWLGYWDQIAFACEEMDRLLAPYAAAQRVVEVAGDVPDLWVPAGGDRLIAMLRAWDNRRGERRRIDDLIRVHLRSLRESDVPALIGGG
jgi:hypothetical protein